MKTLHITNSWHASSGGIATFYRALMAAANEQRQAIRLIVPAPETRVEEVGKHGRIYHLKAPDAPFHRNTYRVLWPAQYLPGGAIHRILREERPDLVEFCDKYSLPFLGGLLRTGLLPGIDYRPAVAALSCERMDEVFRAYTALGRPGAWFTRWFMRWVYFPMADHHIAVSEHTASELRPASRGHKVRRGVWVEPMGVDTHRFTHIRRRSSVRQWLLDKAGGGDRTVLLLYAGRLAPEKNLPLLAETMELLREDTEADYRLLIAGDGSAGGAFRAECARRAPGRVTFLGHMADRDVLADLLANSDAFVHPNPREPFGIGPLEAMAAGLPVVAPDRGGVTTYANESNAWLAEPEARAFAAAVRAMTADPEATRRKAEAARARASQLSWDLVTARYLGLYRELHERVEGGKTPDSEPAFYSSESVFTSTRRRILRRLTSTALMLMMALLPMAGALPGAEGVRRNYKAHAQILVLSLPLFSISNVGDGFASVGSKQSGVTLQFGAGSDPKGAHGLNRLGLIEENVTMETGGAPVAADYFGFMTSSKEESLEEARHTIKAGAGGAAAYTAITGVASGGGMRASRIEVDLPSRYSWHDILGVSSEVRSAIAAKGTPVAVTAPAGHPAATFLYSVHKALTQPGGKLMQRFFYNGKAYRLHTEKQADPGMGGKFVAKRMTRNAAAVWRLSGEVENLATGKRTEFKIWYEPERDERLPLRIEYRARAFLRLIFEYDPAADQVR